jgi:hypothetical protein
MDEHEAGPIPRNWQTSELKDCFKYKIIYISNIPSRILF